MDESTQEKKPAKVQMVKVRVLRPFQISIDGQPVLHDRIGAVVEVPKSELPWLTKKGTGQAKGFGHTTDADQAEHHSLQRAELVAA